MSAHRENTEVTLTRGLGDAGRLVVGGTVSTGLLLGGYVVAGMTLAGRLNGDALLMTSLGLFLVGAVIGLVVSGLFGLFGREDGKTMEEALREAGKGVLYAVPASAVSAVIAGWIAMAVMDLYVGRALPIALTVLAAVIGLGIMAATLRCTWTCGANLIRRVRERL